MRRTSRLFLNVVVILTLLLAPGMFMHPQPGIAAEAAMLPGQEPQPEFPVQETEPPTSPAPITTSSSLTQAMREGRYPTQLAGVTGDIAPNRYGPQRNDPAEGIPRYAYSPFYERNNREHPCPSGGCDSMARYVLLKLEPEIAAQRNGTQAALTSDTTLNQALAKQGVLRLEAVFPGARAPEPGAMTATPDGDLMPVPDLTRWHRAYLEEKADVVATVEALGEAPGVAWAEPDYLRKPAGEIEYSTDNENQQAAVGIQQQINSFTDPLYAQQWHLGATNVISAWQWLEDNGYASGGSRDVIVAVIDTGVDYTHPDLAANMWINAPEFTGTPGVDDDGNGYVDDIYGADMVTPDGNPQDDHGHGTHVAGIIAAQAGNSIGGVGVAYNTQVMALKAAQYSGVLASSDIAEAIYYAVNKGADVINMSFGGYARSQVEEDALAVAFGQAVLVAAAGNDSRETWPCSYPYQHNMYPAAYNWVLGVMAHSQYPDKQGDYITGFSNYDCNPRDTHEYELMAPGMGIWSTLPDGEYAAWAGTSMAAPVVSGIAALARTRWSDKDVYSSRFIMGQIATTGPLMQAYTPFDASPGVFFHTPDALATLTTSPQPELSYLQHWLFDTPDIDPINDNDGIVDASETVDLAIVIRNHWGKAEPVTVTLEAWAEGAYQPDPYVTIITGTVNYGAVGSFNVDDNGLIYEEGAIVGVEHPFRFATDPNTPNDHLIPFRLTITARNGYDPDNLAIYTAESRFYLLVQRGIELPRIISEDMVLTSDYYWIVSDATLISPGATVTVTEGTQVQFHSADPSDPYSAVARPLLQVEGLLRVQGTITDPVEMFTGLLYNAAPVHIRQMQGGSVVLQYAQVENAFMGSGLDAYGGGYVGGQPLDLIEHVYFRNNVECVNFYPLIQALTTRKSIFREVTDCWSRNNLDHLVDTNLFDSSPVSIDAGTQGPYQNNVFLRNFDGHLSSRVATGRLNGETFGHFSENAILNHWWDANTDHWMRFYMGDGRDNVRHIENNYWGTTSTTLIDATIHDFYDDFNLGVYQYQPILTEPPETTYPFVASVALSTAAEPDTPLVGAEVVTFTVAFNRNMDPTVQPMVSFGPSEPYTDYTVHGDWVDARTWQGTFLFTPVTGDGYQLIRVAGAVAADDAWLVTGNDAGRFRFQVETSGTAAMNLQGSGGEGYVDLMWTQTDFDLLAGFNLYRATTIDGEYTRLNSSILPPDQRDWRDTDVIPGQPYYYKFTVVQTSMVESDFSNVATATPIDTIAPVISHTPVASAPPGLPLTLNADVTDNVAVQSVTLFYRALGSSSYSSRVMTKTTGDRYSATLEGSLLVSPGIEYYIQASDGISIVRSGRPDYPHQITVVDLPVIVSVTPNSGPAGGGTAVTLSGSNFKAGATVTFGGAACGSVVVVNSNQITCVTPPHFPETVDVTVTNPDSQSGTLLRGFTFQSETASLGLPHTGGGQYAIVQVPVNLANVTGLAAASLTVTFDPAVLEAQGAAIGNLTPGWSIAANTTTPGEIRISMASGGGTVSGSGVLALLEFEVVGAAGASTTLHSTAISLNDGAIPVDSADGSFTVDLIYSISGAIPFWNGDLISGTLLTLTGDRIYTGLSSATGVYTVANIPTDDYTLVPTKSDDVNGISAYDASLALQNDAGLITLSGYAFTAADVNRSGAVTAMDAYYILQKAVDLITLPFPGSGRVWDFDPQSRSYTNLNTNLTGQDFTAILLGDPSGNWAPQARGGMPALGVEHGDGASLHSVTATLTLPDVAVLPGSVITVPLALTLPQGQIYGADIVVTYDAAIVSALRVVKGPLATGWSMANNLGTPGEIRVALAGATPVTTNGNLLLLVFEAVGTTGAETDLTLVQGDLNEGSIPATLEHGHLRIAVPVQAGFTAAPVSGVAPLTVVFTNTSTGDYDTSAWDFGDGGTSSAEHPTHVYNTPGVYTVTLTVTGDGGEDTETKVGYITVYAAVNAAFSGTPTSGVAPLSVTFTNASSGDYTTCAWTFGDGGTSNVCAPPAHVYAAPGVYTVSLTVSGPGGSDTETKTGYITAYTPVVANFSGTPTSGVAPLTVAFTNTSTGDYTTSLWTFGDGVTSTLTNPSHVYTAAGTYTVTLTVSGPGGQHTTTKSNYITVMFSSVSGAVRFWENSVGLPGVQLTLAGTQVYSTTSAASGAYLLGNVLRDSYVLTPTKSDDANGITAYDASFVLRHAVGLLTLEGPQATAADVNRSGSISALDASYILQRAVNLIPLPFPGAGVVWDFDPATRSYPDVNGAVTGQDFTAILLGDVSGNWAAGNSQVTQTAGPAIVEVRAGVPDPEEVITATVWVDPDGIELYGLDLILNFNPTAATVLAVELGPQGENLVLFSNTSQPGEVRVALAGALPVTSSGALLTLRFQLTDSNQGTPLTPTWGQMNEGAVPVELRGTQLGQENWNVYLPLTLNRYGSAQLLIFESLTKPLSSRLRSR